jgi:hypothetical protein
LHTPSGLGSDSARAARLWITMQYPDFSIT